MDKKEEEEKVPGGPWQSNVGALYLREHKSSPRVQNKPWKGSEGLSGRCETSREQSVLLLPQPNHRTYWHFLQTMFNQHNVR